MSNKQLEHNATVPMTNIIYFFVGKYRLTYLLSMHPFSNPWKQWVEKGYTGNIWVKINHKIPEQSPWTLFQYIYCSLQTGTSSLECHVAGAFLSNTSLCWVLRTNWWITFQNHNKILNIISDNIMLNICKNVFTFTNL